MLQQTPARVCACRCPELLQQGGGSAGAGLFMGHGLGGTGGRPGSAHAYDARAVDAWAMGVLLYLLVTGRYPFEVRACVQPCPHALHRLSTCSTF